MAVNKRTGDKPVRLERDVRSSRREADNTDRVRLAYFIQNTKPSFRGKCAFCDKKGEEIKKKKRRKENKEEDTIKREMGDFEGKYPIRELALTALSNVE